MSASSVQSPGSCEEQDRQCLHFSLQASSAGQAANIAAELGTIATDVACAPMPLAPGGDRPEWIVTLRTPPMALTFTLVQRWERELLAVVRRWPGCRFLGWTTRPLPTASIGSTEERTRDRDGTGRGPSQRELVVASLLRCPSRERRGIVHGRGVPR